MIGMISGLAGEIIGHHQSRKKARQAAARSEEKRADLDLAFIEAEIRRRERTGNTDINHDI